MDMAQSNVAREPSMDEILASIRKIIESNELGPIGSADDVAIASDNDAVESIERAIASAMPAVTELHVESVIERSSAEDDEVVEAPKSMSLADVAARVRAASEQRYAENTAKLDEAVLSQTSRPNVQPDPSNAVRVAPPKAEFVLQAPAPIRASEPEPSLTMENAPVLTVASEQKTGGLLSEQTGQHVAQSFSDLAVAISSSPRRSFDEIAQEMMRPMLTEWLDDNLPKLVERLVREEIERVARGPRR
jgi:cell pole-organizing protein PopZ